MVVLTDGVSNDNERSEADLAKAAGIVIISVGIGNNLDVPMLIDIAQDSSHYLQTEYSQLAVTLSAFVQSKVPCPWCKYSLHYYCQGKLFKLFINIFSVAWYFQTGRFLINGMFIFYSLHTLSIIFPDSW